MTGRRTVRVRPEFFDDLDAQLGAERGPNGEPSRNDFEVFELLRIVDRVAEGFAELPTLIVGRDDYRLLIVTGILAKAVAVVVQEAPDGVAEIVSVDIDLYSLLRTSEALARTEMLVRGRGGRVGQTYRPSLEIVSTSAGFGGRPVTSQV